ncbi:polysaccharide deacetylase family protein [Dehalobacterium formicoaceticum]|uniref:Polysaccharide deacetylase family protein n=1 Tax=Dehalobacterium formicoaceticum TaxID=51515 RepID=A0ABT1Y3W0_9FIRM|nr:polysaccharide deacetylase family protein [Dehalobacterium formicoaceticum]MCR6545557.1 polysaccharide deacetylase family protein [Dehalobacterium formicoaceticum]
MKKLILILILISIICFASVGLYRNNGSKTEITVLTYHHLDEKNRNSVTLLTADFKKQMAALKEAGYTFLTASELSDIINKNEIPPPKPLLVTFDDGYLSNYTYAYPILREMGLKGTIFVVTGEMGKTPGNLPHFTWAQGKEMADSGVIDIQSHSHESHYNFLVQNEETGEWLEKPALTNRLFLEDKRESLDQYEKRIREDLLQSKQLIEKNIGTEAVAIAYPYGAHSKAVRYLTKDSGFQLGFITKEGFNSLKTDPFQLKRFNVFGDYSVEKLLSLVDGSAETTPAPIPVTQKIKPFLKRIYLHVYQFIEYIMIRYN